MVAIIGVLAAVTIPSLLRAKMSGNEVSAIGSLRTINTAEAAYADVAASGAYATQLSVLTQPCPGGSQGFLSTEFAADPSQKSGYVIVLDPGSAVAGPGGLQRRQHAARLLPDRRTYHGQPDGHPELRHVERGGHLFQSVGRTADRGTDWPRGRRHADPVVRSAQFFAGQRSLWARRRASAERGLRPERERGAGPREPSAGSGSPEPGRRASTEDGKLMACATRAALP